MVLSDDILSTVIGVVFGVAASIPTSLLIVAATAGSRRRNIYQDLGAAWQQPNIVIEAPGREIAVFDAEFRELTPSTAFAPTCGRRRMEMTRDRIEAVCAGHKVVAHVRSGGCTRRGRLVMIVTTDSDYDLRNLKDDIRLSLGVPVRVYRDAVICEVTP